MAIIISYDLAGDNSTREEVRNAMLKLSYQTTINKLGKTYSLPETTLFNQARVNPSSVVDELKKAVENANKGKEQERHVKLEKCIASVIDNTYEAWPPLTNI